MSKITTIYDEAITLIEGVLPNHQRLANPYQIEENPEIWLDQGYAVAIRTGVNTKRQISCRLSIERQISIVITRKYYGNDADASRKATTEKSLLEDQLLIINEFESQTPFSVSTKSEFVSDSGIVFVFSSEEKPFYMIESTFGIEYFENIS